MRRSLDKIAAADAVLFMVDASQPLQECDLEIRPGGKRLCWPTRATWPTAGVIHPRLPARSVHLVSAKHGDNLGAVSAFLKNLQRNRRTGRVVAVNLAGRKAVGLQHLSRSERLRPRPVLPVSWSPRRSAAACASSAN
jgi:hypothetical protein